MSIQDDIQAEAANLGFSLFGISSLETPPHYPVYERWLEQGRHAGMAYLATPRARQRRSDPGQILPGGRSALVLGIRYASPTHLPAGTWEEGHGRVAAYAWGQDYHTVLPVKMDLLGVKLEHIFGHAVRKTAYTDTGPVLERDFAQRAGLGWIGKNTNLISRQHGSFFFLAEILVDVELEPGPAITSDHCGTCRRCIEACPTDCIQEDRTIDAGRCISYLTIENKGSIPSGLRPAIGNWIFGCDVCQAVCPWNLRFATLHSDDEAFEPHQEDIAAPHLLSELRLSAQEFNRKFKHSPIQRARRKGYLRNISVALGNLRHPDAVPALSETLRAIDLPLVRAHAAWALGQINTTAARTALERALPGEEDEAVIEEIKAALEQAGV
ncbi:MAG: tRNA epoxyqueuosine(34) reductase QueG [Chloroflexi bacterium]|nr:tRNA epoxyqueuosine(34) reductase QueG [Chloroflexota bacterium]